MVDFIGRRGGGYEIASIDLHLNDESKPRVRFAYSFYMKINEDDIKELISYEVTEKLNFDHSHGL